MLSFIDRLSLITANKHGPQGAAPFSAIPPQTLPIPPMQTHLRQIHQLPVSHGKHR